MLLNKYLNSLNNECLGVYSKTTRIRMYARLGLPNSTRYYPISEGRLDELQNHSVLEYCKMTQPLVTSRPISDPQSL